MYYIICLNIWQLIIQVVNFTNILWVHLRQFSCAKKFKPKM